MLVCLSCRKLELGPGLIHWKKRYLLPNRHAEFVSHAKVTLTDLLAKCGPCVDSRTIPKAIANEYPKNSPTLRIKAIALPLRSCLSLEEGLHVVLRHPNLWCIANGWLRDSNCAKVAAKIAMEATGPDDKSGKQGSVLLGKTIPAPKIDTLCKSHVTLPSTRR